MINILKGRQFFEFLLKTQLIRVHFYPLNDFFPTTPYKYEKNKIIYNLMVCFHIPLKNKGIREA